MKALCCMSCSTVTSPPRRAGEWRFCDCQASAIRWVDTVRGQAEVWTSFPEYTWVLGLNNMVLTLQHDQVERAGDGDIHAGWAKVHDAAVEITPAQFLFSKRQCWAVLFKPGETGDVKRVEERPDLPD